MKLQDLKKTVQETAHNVYEIVTALRMSQTLQEHIENLSHEKDKNTYELNKLTREYELYALKNKGLQDIEKHFFNGEPKLHQHELTLALREEIKRLMNVIETQQELIEKTPFLTSELIHTHKPILIKSNNPIRSIKNYVRYRNELHKYNEMIARSQTAEFHLTIEKGEAGIRIDRDGTQRYKSEYLEEYSRSVGVGERIKRFYYLADIPAYLSPYIFFRLLTSSLPFTLSIFMEPTPSRELLKIAKKRKSVLETQQLERLKQGKVRDQELDKNIDEVSTFIDELVHEAERGVIYSLYLQLEAENEQKMNEYHKQLENLTGTIDLTFNQYSFGQKKAFRNFIPFNHDNLQENRVLQTTAASYLLPFISKQLTDPQGIFMGMNSYNSSLVFIDPFTSRNNNINILGVSGSGKSVTSKILMNRLYMRGIQILVIDPEGEYVDLAKSLGGEVISFSRENGINPFYINSSQENDILDHISTLKTFFKFFIPDNHYDGAILDKALIKLYDTGTPSFEGLLELLNKHPMSRDLGVLSSGSLRGVFNSSRKLELDNDIIVLDLHDLKKDEKREPAMYLLTSLIWNLINKNNDKQRMLFIDEAHKLLVDHEVAVFYRELVKQARKRKVGVVSITQDVEDFLQNEYGKAIITNSETKILLKQSYATLNDIATIYPMTDEEKQQLGHLGIGEVILFREGEHIRLNVVVLPHEKSLVFTSS